MIFKKKEEKRSAYTIEQCSSCKKEIKQEFKNGDYVFKETSSCSACKGQILIIKIFGELIKE